MKEKNIVFVRHAHRDKPFPDQDNGLSEKGLGQVKQLVNDYKRKDLPEGKHFWTSPKKRCVETLEPISHEAKISLKIEKLLDEQQSSEAPKDFSKRIENLMKKAVAVGETIYLCSHGDVIPEAIDFLTGRHVDVAKGEAIQLVFSGCSWELS